MRIPWLIVLAVFLAAPLRAADDFGDISVSASAIYTGNTYHGYAEMRVILENRSESKGHSVTLVYPNQSYGGYGNNLSRVSRGVSLAPGAREVVSLLQPPLPAQGDSSIRVEVDGRHEGEVRAPNANNHCDAYMRSTAPATVFVSRSLDYDAVARVFQAASGGFTAAKAVGPPDAGGRGFQVNCWMPDARGFGHTNWLELSYVPPPVANRIVIYQTQPASGAGNIVIIGVSGKNLAVIPMSSGSTSASSLPSGSTGTGRRVVMGSDWQTEFTFPATSEPVRTVRLVYPWSAPGTISIDAVQLSGPGGSQWAADARASSDNSAAAPAYLPGGVSADAVESLRAESPVSEWSADWLAYSPFDAVVLNAADLGEMPPPVVAALGDYLVAGGNIVVFGTGSLPLSWHPIRRNPMADGVKLEAGFGGIYTLTTENPVMLDPATTRQLREAVRESARYFENLPGDSTAANGIMPVVENLKIPTRGIVLVMLGFVIVIGPVNMIYLNRIRRRTWMLWTIPAISLATTLLVFAYSLLREGIRPNARIAGLTMLDQVSHSAATIGGEAFYCPLTPSGGLNFDFETEATPLVSGGYGAGTSRDVDWTQSQHFQHGWISARVPAHFHLRKAETRRERIQIVNDNGRLEVVNGLGAPVKTLWVADADLNVYEAENVAAGDKGGLIPSKQPRIFEKAGPGGLLHDLGFVARADSMGDAAKYLLPNTYIAVLDGNPFIENALGMPAGGKRTKSSGIVFGILDASDGGGFVK